MSQPLTLRLTETAEADLAEIWAYVASEALEATAKRLLDKIMATCEMPCHFPLAGVARESFALGLRAVFVGNYVLYYQHDARELVIVRVLHGGRDATAMAQQGAFNEK